MDKDYTYIKEIPSSTVSPKSQTTLGTLKDARALLVLGG